MIHVALMALAVATGFVIRRFTSTPLAIPWWQKISILFGAIVFGAVAAKLPFLFTDVGAALDGTAWLADGRTLTWGLAGGYLGVEIAKLAVGVRVKTGDGFAAPIAASIAIGRIGCFLAPCCYGVATDLPWGVDFGDGVRRHPTQLYEFAFHALACAVLIALAKKKLLERQRVKLYLVLYMIYRFFTEWLRPEPDVALGLTFYQWSSLAFAAIFAALWAFDASRPQAEASMRPTDAAQVLRHDE